MQIHSRPLQVFHSFVAIGGLVIGINTLTSGAALLGAIACFCTVVIVVVCLIAAMRTTNGKHEAIIHIILFILEQASSVYSTALVVEDFYRYRTMGVNLVLWRFVIALFAFPRGLSFLCLTICSANDVIANFLAEKVHKTTTPTRAIVNWIVYNLLVIPILELTTKRFRMLYDAQEELKLEKHLLQTMLAMLCDGSMTIASDADTILHCNEGFDLLMHTSMSGEALMRYIPDSQNDQERERVKAAFKRAKSGPVLFPTTVITENMATLNVELVIVYRGALTDSKDQKVLSGYDVGVRTVYQEGAHKDDDFDIEEPSGWQAGQPVVDEHGHEPNCDDQTCLSHQESLPSTTYTGHVFRKVNDGIKESTATCILDDHMQLALQELIELGEREHWLIDEADVQQKPGIVLGSGGFGTVVGADMYGMEVAMKVASCNQTKSYVQVFLSLSNELRVLRHVRHPNMVLFHGATVNATTGEIALVLERVYGQEMSTFLATCKGREGLPARLQIITDVCCALWYLHAQKPQIVHGDLKGSNVLIEQRSTGARAKLLDFGLSRLMTHDVKPLGGTLSWMAPELIKSPTKKPRASADIFSFGRFVHFTVTGSKPFIGVSQQPIMAMAKKGQVPPLNWEKADAMCEKGVAICERCLVYPPSQRLTIADVHAEIAAWSA